MERKVGESEVKKISKLQDKDIYKDIIDFAPIGFYQTTRGGEITMVNEKFASLFGYKQKEELLSKNIADFYFDRNERERIIAKFDVQPSPKSKNAEIKFKKKDGTPIWILLTARAIKNEENITINYDGYIVDISIQKEAQNRQAESELQLEAYVNSSSSMIYIKDENQKYLKANKSICNFLNKTENEIRHKSDEEIFENPFGKDFGCSDKKAIIENEKNHEIKQLGDQILEITKIPLQIGNKNQTAGIIRNITEQKKQENIQQFLYEISELSFSDNSLSDYLGKIHQEIKKFISAENFYIALYDSSTEQYAFPYHIDAITEYPENYISKLEGSLTNLVRETRKGKIIVGEAQEQVYSNSNAKVIEEPSAAWMGAPIINKLTEEIIGVIAVQDYSNLNAYTESELKVLEIIAHNIGIFIKRVEYVELLEIAKKKAEESNEVYHSLFNKNASVMILVDDINGKIVDANQSASDFYGYSKKKMCTLSIPDISIDNKKSILDEITKTKQKRKFRSEHKHKLSNGKIVDVEVFSGEIILNGKSLIYSIINDISHRKKAEYEIHRLNSAIDQSLSPIAQIDLNGKIIYANPGYCNTSGYTHQELIGQPTSIHKSGITPLKAYKNLWDTISSGKVWKDEITNKKKNGELYVEEVVITPVYNKERELLSYIKVSRDITDDLKIKNELIKAKEKAEESDRLKSAFLMNVSHEIRTPMNGILGFTDLLQDANINGEEKNEFINIIKQCGERLLRTVNDLIDISMIESAQVKISKTKLNITEQIQDLYLFFKPEAEQKGIQLEFINKAENKGIDMVTDKTKFVSILTNLIKNAIKYSNKGIIKIDFECMQEEDSIRFSVKDQGIGIAHDKLDRIFNRFEQEDIETSKIYEGSGVGLSIAKGYVEALGGKIWVESEKNKGSNFQFTLPLNS
ncbi:PAS domain S-box protein [Ancylomarina sp. 16SWW S1-10-2]|uniref:PAS domain S-box protein n=1 Tax=Ancylomarina sp. 16SWW S1-10-2 TaxID=2499681 RepID=UPI0012AD2EA2|nr:PAS domain S-box protein [Ancylomarina sp. 16SWW S1-10-2]MRT93532.1 PAS domain S-box protein [Ancylomarina sp. 16SWW S1-10-2]